VVVLHEGRLELSDIDTVSEPSRKVATK
jgi:hypothetical protein